MTTVFQHRTETYATEKCRVLLNNALINRNKR